MAVTRSAGLGRSFGGAIALDRAPLRPLAHEQREAKSGAAPARHLVPVRDDDRSQDKPSRARVYSVRLILPDGPPPTQGTPLADAPFVARIFDSGRDRVGSAARTVRGQTDSDGVMRVALDGGEDRIVLEIAGRTIKVRAGALRRLDGPNAAHDEQVKLRLYNLGYGSLLPATWSDAEYTFLLALFQKQHGVAEEEWGQIGPETIRALRRHHDGDA